MFLWKDKKQTDLMVDQVGDFIKETIPKRGIWNPLLLNGESLNLYPVEITNVESNLYPLEKDPREKGFEEKSISTTSLQNIHPTGVSFSRTRVVTTSVYAPSSDPGAAIPLQESEHLISTQRMDDKLHPSESLMQPRSEIFASALLSSTLISHSLENLKTEYSDGISNQFSEMPMLPSMQGSHMDFLPTQTDDMSPKSELKVPSNSVRDNIDLYLQSLLPILPTTKQPPKLIDPLREFESDNDFLNFFTQPQKPPTSSIVKDQTKDVDFDHLLSDDFQNIFPFLNQESISTPFSEPATTQAELLKSQKVDTISTTLDFIGTPSMPTLQMFTSSSMMSDDQKLYTNVIPSILTPSPVTSAQVEHDLQMNSIVPLSSQKPDASKSTILEKLKPTSQIHEKSSSVSPSKSSEVVTPSISTFGSDGDMFNFFSEASSLDSRPPKISSFSIGDPGLHSEADNTPSFGGFGDFFSQFSTIEDSTNDMLPPNILMGSAESTLHASVTSSLDQNLYSERVLDTVINNDPEQIETFTRDTFKPSAFSLANSERIESKSDSKPANFDDFTQSLQPSMTNSFPEKSQGHESVAINSIYSSTFSSTMQNPMSLSGDIFTLSQGQHDLRSSLSIQTNEVEAFRDSAKKTLVKSIIPSASFSDKIPESHSQSLLVTPSVEHLQNLESYKLLKSDNSYSISSRNTDLRSSISLETTEVSFGETILKASYPVHETTDFYSLTSTLYHLTATELLYSGNETPSLSYDQMSTAVSSLKESQSSIQPSKLTTLLQTQEMSYPSSSHQFSDKLYNFRSSQFSNVATDPSKWMSLGELLPVHSIDDSVLISHTDHSIRSSLPSTTYVSFEQSMPISDGLHFKMSKPSEGSITKSSIHSTIDQNLQTEIQKADIQSSESRYRETETMSALHRTPKNESVSQEQMTSTGFTTENELSSNSNILDVGSMGSSTNVVYAESMKSSDDQQKQSILTIQSETISSKHILSTSFTPTYMSNVNSEIIAPGDSSIIEYTEEPSWSFSASSNVKPSDEMLIKDGFSNEHTSTESLFSETSRLIPKFETLSEIKHSTTSVPFIESSPSDMMGSVDFESTEILTDVTSSKRESLITSKITQSAFIPQPSDIDKFSHSNSFIDIQLKSTLTTTILGYSNSFTDFMLSEEGMGSERSELNYPMTLSDGAKHSILESGRVAASYSNLLTDEKSQNTPFIQVTISREELHSLNPTSIWDLERQTEYFEKSTSINDISLTSSYNQNSQENTIVSSNVLSSEPMTYVPSDVLTNDISEQPYTTDMSKVEESKSIMMDLKTEDHSGFPVLPFSNNIETSSSLYIAGTEDTQTIRSTFQAMDKLLQTAYSPSKSKSQQTATIDQVYKSEISDSPLNKFIEPSSTGDQSFAIILPESLTKSSGASSLLHNTNVDSSFGLSISDFLSPSASDTLTYAFNQESGTEPLRGLLTPFFDSATVDGYMTSTADALDTSSPNKLMMELSTYTSSATVMPPEDIYFNTEQTKDLGQTPQGITQNMHKSKTSMLLAGSLSTDLINIASFDTVDPLSESMSSNKTTSIELPKILETSIPSISAVNFHQSLSLTDGQTDSMFRWDSSVPNVESSVTTEDLPNSNVLRDLIVNQGGNLQPSKLQQTITSSFSSMPSFAVVDQTVEGFAEVSNIRLTTAGITQTYDLSSVILTNGIQSSITNDILEKTATASDMGIFRENEIIQSLQMESGLVTSNRLSTSQANSAHMESDIDRLFTPIHIDSQQMVELKSVDDLANFLTQTYTSSSEFEELGMMTINHINDSVVQFPVMPTEEYLSSSQPPLHSSPNIPAESFMKQTEIASFMLSNSENFKTFSLNAPASTTMTQAIDSNLISSSALISDNPTLDGNFKHKIPYSLPSAISSNSMPSDSTLTMITNALTNDVIVPSNSLFDTLTSTNPLPPTSSLQSESSVIQTLVWETTTAVSENILPSTFKLYKTMDSTNDNETTSLQLTDSLLTRTDHMNQILPTKASTDFSSTNTILNSIPLYLSDSLSTDVQLSDNSIIVGSIDTFTLNLSNYSSTVSSQSQKYLQITSTPALFTSTVDLMTLLEGSESNISPQDFTSIFVQHTSLSMFQSKYSLVPSILALGNASGNESNRAGLEMPSKVFDNYSMTDSQIRNLFPTKVETQTELFLADSTTPIYQLMSSEMETALSNVSIETQTYTLEDTTLPIKISQTLDFNSLLTASPSTLSQIQTDSYSPLAVMSSVDAMNSSGPAITSGLSSDTVTPIMEENPSLTTDSQINAPIQTTPYDVSSDTLLTITEESPSLNLGSQTINPNTPDAQINSTEYLFGSSVIFSSLESSDQVGMHEFISKSSTYESSFEFSRDKVFLDSNSDMYKEATSFHTLTMVSVDDSYVLSEELSYGKGTSSQTSSILSTNGPLVTILDVSPTLTLSMLTDSFSEKYLTNETILTSSPDHSLFLPQPASISSLPFPNLTTIIGSAGTKERETLGVDKDANIQDKKALQSLSPDTASSIIYSSVSEGYIPKVRMNKKLSYSGNNERYTSMDLIQPSSPSSIKSSNLYGGNAKYASAIKDKIDKEFKSNRPSAEIPSSSLQLKIDSIPLSSRLYLSNDLKATGILDEISKEPKLKLPHYNEIQSVSLDFENKQGFVSEISISLNSLTQISINTNGVWSTEINSSFSPNGFETNLPSIIKNDQQQTSYYPLHTNNAGTFSEYFSDFNSPNYASNRPIREQFLKVSDTLFRQSGSSTTFVNVDPSMSSTSRTMFNNGLLTKSNSSHSLSTIWSSLNFIDNRESFMTKMNSEVFNLVQSETRIIEATLVRPTNVKSSSSVTRESSVDTFLFTAANDYDYYATNLDFFTDYVDLTAPTAIASSTIPPSSSVSHGSREGTTPSGYSHSTHKSHNLQNVVEDSGLNKPVEVLPLFWPTASGHFDIDKEKKQKSQVISSQNYIDKRNLQASGLGKDVIRPSLQRPSPIDLKMTTPLITNTEQTVTSSALSMDMDYDDPFAAFFGNTGPAIPQWVIDMLGSVHDSPSSTAKLYFRH